MTMPIQRIISDEMIMDYLNNPKIRFGTAPDIAVHYAFEFGWKGTGNHDKYKSTAELIQPYVNQSALKRSLERLVKEGRLVHGGPHELSLLFGSNAIRRGKSFYWSASTDATIRQEKEQQADKAHRMGLRRQAKEMVLDKYQDEVEALFQQLLKESVPKD